MTLRSGPRFYNSVPDKGVDEAIVNMTRGVIGRADESIYSVQGCQF